MGLDQYAYIKENSGEIDGKPQEQHVDVATWRKHPNLQGYMEALWIKRGGEGQFNMVEVELSKEDILELNKAIIKQDLPKTVGFFYGNDADEYYKKADLKFISEALKHINEGSKIYYSSWW